MDNQLSKRQLLDGSGYRYNFDRMIYVNRHARKIFSFEVVEDNDVEWLSGRIAEPNPSNEWIFYFNGPVSESVRRQLLKELQ
jgi:hypothetical protein